MRPLVLKLSAFLSYAREECIDFRLLGSSGLYIITGETGAGKTAIFDAITYALYGEPSGDLRSGKMLRCRHASPETETYVELCFECRGKEYTVRRAPEYERAKKRGTGTTTQPAEAVLWLPDGSAAITRVEEVTRAIVNLLGLDRDQFSQVAMIAQGQFRELLVSDTSVRQEIFRNIFATDNYKRLQDKIKADCSEARAAREGKILSIRQDISSIICDEEDFSPDRAADTDMLDNHIIAPLAELIERDSAARQKTGEELTAANEQHAKAIAAVEKARAYEKTVLDIANKELEYSKCSVGFESAKEELSATEGYEGRVNALISEIAKAEEKIPDYEKLERIRQELEAANASLKRHSAARGIKQKELRAVSQTLEEQKLEKAKYESVDSDIEKRSATLRELNTALEGSWSIISRFDTLREKESLLEGLRKKSLETYKSFESADAQYREYNLAYLSNMAGILAAELTEGEKCPVCGSLQHPSPAALSENAVTKPQVDRAEAERTRAKSIYDAALKELDSESGACAAYEAETFSQAKKLTDGETADTLRAGITALAKELEAEADSVKSALKALERDRARLNELKRSIPQLEDKCTYYREEITELDKSLAKLTAEIESRTRLEQELLHTLEFESVELARAQLAELEKEKTRLSAARKQALEKYNGLKEQLSQLSGQLKTLNCQLNTAEALSSEEELRKLEQISARREALNEAMGDSSLRISTNKKLLASLESKRDELKELTLRYVRLSSLDDTASGKAMGSSGKLMLETYVQQAYFDRIVSKANKRFAAMSRGKYSLRRAHGALDNRSQSGLDLEIIDHYNGSTQSVKSLSGGEQFEASLSLALGLSDMVQETSAGVKLDCMFIDEGFGTLDETTLKTAITVLKELSGGSRTVGIISHVEMLEREIDRKIVVSKDAGECSHAKIEVNG